MEHDSGYWIQVTSHFQCVKCLPLLHQYSSAEQHGKGAYLTVIYRSDKTATIDKIQLDRLQMCTSFPKTFPQPKQLPREGRNRWVSETMASMSRNITCAYSHERTSVLPRFHELSGSLGVNAKLSTLHRVLKSNERDFFYDASRLPYTILRRPDQFSAEDKYISVQINSRLQFRVHEMLNGAQLLSMVAELEEISHRCRNDVIDEIPPQNQFLMRSF